jgi:hypothetical protein
MIEARRPAAASVGFIRVRKRKRKKGERAQDFDLVRAIRVNGKSRHRVLLSLRSLRDECQDRDLVLFWADAFVRMAEYGLSASQCHRLATEMVRKGARLPIAAQCHTIVSNMFELAAVEADA